LPAPPLADPEAMLEWLSMPGGSTGKLDESSIDRPIVGSIPCEGEIDCSSLGEFEAAVEMECQASQEWRHPTN
jgi:hypothetical protein